MTYQVTIARDAERELARMQPRLRARVGAALLSLERDPRPPGVLNLVGEEGWRIRVGDYRILYAIDDGARVVIVFSIGHRREVYR